jgi:hypothetical protein
VKPNNLIHGLSGGKVIQHDGHHDARAFYASFAMTYRRIGADTGSPVHL